MIAMALLVLFGVSALKSNTENFTDYVKQTGGGFWEATVTPSFAYPEGNYLESGCKEIAWGPEEAFPPRIAFTAPEPAREIAAVLAPRTPLDADADPVSIKKIAQNGVEDLGLLAEQGDNIDVNHDEILSFFEKQVSMPRNNEEKASSASPKPTPRSVGGR